MRYGAMAACSVLICVCCEPVHAVFKLKQDTDATTHQAFVALGVQKDVRGINRPSLRGHAFGGAPQACITDPASGQPQIRRSSASP